VIEFIEEAQHGLKMKNLDIREAVQSDMQALTQLLTAADLMPQDVLAPGTKFWLAHNKDSQLAGCAGMEFGETAVLLRNVAILPAFRKQGWGTELVEHVLLYARDRGYKAVYLFSVRSGGYWLRLGFREVSVDELLQAIPNAFQVQHFNRIGKLKNEHAWKRALLSIR